MARILPNAARVAGFLLAFGLLASAEDITLKSGEVLKNATVSSSDPATLTFLHDDGLTRVPFQNLPDALQKQYGFSLDKAGQFNQQVTDTAKRVQEQKAREEAYRALNKLAIPVQGKIFQTIGAETIAGQTTPPSALVDLSETKTEVTVKRFRAVYPPTALGPSGLAGPLMEKREVTEKLEEVGLCFIEGLTGVQPDNFWKGEVWVIGKYRYKNARGSDLTVPRVTANRIIAAKQLGYVPRGSGILRDTGKTIEAIE